MASSHASQYDYMPGAFPSDHEDGYLYLEYESSSNSREEPPYTEESFVEMMNDVTREHSSLLSRR